MFSWNKEHGISILERPIIFVIAHIILAWTFGCSIYGELVCLAKMTVQCHSTSGSYSPCIHSLYVQNGKKG
jgi:hypothetical protein